jgi:two-component system, OmpR family, sensor histidine kinase TctE
VRRFRQSPQSLTERLLWTLAGSLAVVAVFLGIGGALFIERIAEQTSDRVLGASVRAIAETLAVEDGQITLDLPPSALGMLENNERDNVYYSIRHEGELLTGYADLSQTPLRGLRTEATVFRYDHFRGAGIRIATEARRLPRIKGLVVVEVAETLEARHTLAAGMLMGLTLLEGLLVMIAGLLVWPTLKWSLKPITRLKAEMDIQPLGGARFTPLKTDALPGELVGLVVGFNALLQRLDEAVEGIRSFTSDASHQMRTPLAVLRTHIAVLRKHVRPQGLASLRDVEAAAERLQHLLTRLVTLARTDEVGGNPGSAGPSDLLGITAQVVAALEEHAQDADVRVSVSATGECVAACDAILTAEILTNLLDNAIRYNSVGGRAKVILCQADDSILMCVEDDGPGIPDENLEQVFQRFFRLPRDQQRAGSGLGLSIVRALAKTIDADVTIGKGLGGRGLRVAVRLPAAHGAPAPGLA